MPDVYPTNICFGGADMKTAYITLSGSGQLAAMDWPEPGLRLNFMTEQQARSAVNFLIRGDAQGDAR